MKLRLTNRFENLWFKTLLYYSVSNCRNPQVFSFHLALGSQLSYRLGLVIKDCFSYEFTNLFLHTLGTSLLFPHLFSCHRTMVSLCSCKQVEVFFYCNNI
ncbi:hypothetical protein CW304_27690 [Bacillus sp. UFRGS-B20]|nr:hypothetical protein CW304_27690 [Bacillus sp. UFRGS-B20]